MVMAMVASFSKENDLPKKPVGELLTQQEWTLAAYGYDKNNNGLVDNAEEMIRDCERDNSYEFDLNGSGIIADNALSCGNGISEQSFIWKSTENETALDLNSGVAKILRLDENNLVLSENIAGQPTKLITHFKR